MFNTIVRTGNQTNIQKTYTNLNINAVSGTLIKTFEKSYFKRFQEGSTCEHFYFSDNKNRPPCRIVEQKRYDFELSQKENLLKVEYDNYWFLLEPVYVLQVMLCGNETFLIEAITQEEYNKIFSIENN